MTHQKTDIIARNAAEKIGYFLSCYADLETASYDNSSLEALTLTENNLLWYDTCRSTSDMLGNHIKNASELQPMVCISENQYAGRGQHGREWLSAEGNLHFSLLIPNHYIMALDGKLTLEIAMSLLEMSSVSGLKMLSKGRVGIKWPNDLCFMNADDSLTALHKFAGILVEPVKDKNGSLAALIIGIGINVNNTQLDTTADGQPIANLSQLLGHPVDIGLLAAEVCYACQHALTRFTRGSAGIFARFYMHDLLYDLPVKVKRAAAPKLIKGTAEGVAADGALKVTTDTETIHLYDGQVSLL